MKAVVPLVILALVAVSSAAATPSLDSGNLYLQSDGTLAKTPGTSQPCPALALSATSSSSVSATFKGAFTAESYEVDNQSVTVSLAFAPNSSPGSGFTITGALQVGNLTVATTTTTYSAGASLSSPAILALDIPAGTTSGPVKLDVQLAKSSVGPLPLVQNVGITCNTEETRIHGFPYRASGEPSTTTTPKEAGPKGGSLSIPSILGIAALAGLTTLVAGALVLSGRHISQRRIHFLLGATAGLLLAIAMLDLVPEAIASTPSAPITIVIALLVLFLVRHFAGDHGHDHTGADHAHGHDDPGHEHTHEHAATHVAGLAFIAFFALGFHRFIDGVVLPAAFEAGNGVGFAAASAVLIHQFPDGVAAASLFLAAGWARRKVLGGVAIMAVLTPIGAMVGLLLLGHDELVGHLIALAAATFIFISLAELLPELRAKEQRGPVGLGFAIGYAVAFLIVIVPALVGIKV